MGEDVMASKKMNVIVWLMKAAERDVVKQSCVSNLVGLHFDYIYTMPYAMCLNTIAEIFSTLKIEDDKNIISTTRFSNVGLVSNEEMVVLQNTVANFVKNTPIDVGVWQEVAKKYFEMSVKKATESINKTFTELAAMPGNSFTVLVINNDKMPLLELLTASLNKSLKIPSEGELLQLRFEGTVGAYKVDAELVYASLHPVDVNEHLSDKDL
jgi:hypothetical protein